MDIKEKSAHFFSREEDVTASEWDQNYKKVVGAGVAVINIKDVKGLDEINFYGGEPREDDIYVKHPFKPSSFVKLDKIEDFILKHKFNGLALVSSYLGAKNTGNKPLRRGH